MLKQEIEILKRIEHNSIIRFENSFECKNNIVLVIEFCPGGTLQDMIFGQNKMEAFQVDEEIFPDEVASKIMKSIFEAVSYLHSQGIVHRDIKPENVLLKENGLETKLIDFGLSAKYDDSCPMSFLDDHCGTLLYMAPEIALKQEYSKSIDVWALGIVMYNLLSRGGHPLHLKGESLDLYEEKLARKEKLYFDDSFSSLAKDLISRLTSYSPVDRLTVDQALTHPWITRSHSARVPLTRLEMLKNFDSADKFKKV